MEHVPRKHLRQSHLPPARAMVESGLHRAGYRYVNI